MWRLNRPDVLHILENPGVQRALTRYVGIVKGERIPKFLIARMLPTSFDLGLDADELFTLHWKQLGKYMETEKQIDQGILEPDKLDSGSSFMDLKIELANRIMSWCRFCERRCGVNRLKGEKGYCQCGDDFTVASCFPHMGEEPELVPSGTVFTYGCTIRCVHCQNWDISQWHGSGSRANPSQMAEIVKDLRRKGCRNLNMVGGEPTPNTSLWLETMRNVNPQTATTWKSKKDDIQASKKAYFNMALIWNSNSYYSRETAMLLAGFIDLYLLDFKYGNNDCAEGISDAPGYWEACTRNHLLANRFGELIIRVLVLPGHNECCTRPILEWIAENLGPWTRVNVMFQYRPEWRANERPELRRRLTKDERRRALQIAKEVGLKNLVRG